MEFTVDSTGFYIDGHQTSGVEFLYALGRSGVRITYMEGTSSIAGKQEEFGMAPMEIDPRTLKRICDQARAYGWEHGRLAGMGEDPTPRNVIESTPGNPFTDPNWDTQLNLPQGWLLSAKDVAL